MRTKLQSLNLCTSHQCASFQFDNLSTSFLIKLVGFPLSAIPDEYVKTWLLSSRWPSKETACRKREEAEENFE
jgi:hypothetical protein